MTAGRAADHVRPSSRVKYRRVKYIGIYIRKYSEICSGKQSKIQWKIQWKYTVEIHWKIQSYKQKFSSVQKTAGPQSHGDTVWCV